MNAEEIIQFIWPSLFPINDENLSSDNPPEMLNLNRANLDSSGIYVLFNQFLCYVWVGKDADPFFIDLLFNTQNQDEVINMELSEYDMFSEEQLAKGWVSELYNILFQFRTSANIYPQFTVLFEKDAVRSEK